MGKQRGGGGGGGKSDRAKLSIDQYRKRLGHRENHQLRYSRTKSLKTKEVPDFEPKSYIRYAKTAGIVFLVTMCTMLVFYFSGGYNIAVVFIRQLLGYQ